MMLKKHDEENSIDIMQMKKTCIIRNIALDDVDEKTVKHRLDDVKKQYYKKHCT